MSIPDLDGPYRDALSALKMKLAYIHILAKEKDGGFEQAKEQADEHEG